MPRTHGQAKRNTPAPATTPAKVKTPRSATTRRQAPRAGAHSGRDVHPHPPTTLPAPDPQEDPQAISPMPPASSSPRDRPQDHLGPPQVALSPQLPEDLAALWPDLQAIAHWWHERQRLAQQDETPDRKLVRQTYHIEQRYIDAVRREADRTGESYAAVVNRAFARYFAGRSRGPRSPISDPPTTPCWPTSAWLCDAQGPQHDAQAVLAP